MINGSIFTSSVARILFTIRRIRIRAARRSHSQRLLLLGILCLYYAPCGFGQQYNSRSCPGDTKCFSYGYVNANVTVHSPVHRRVKITSDVFSFCLLDTHDGQITADAKNKVERDVKSQFGQDAEITYIFVDWDDTRDKVTLRRARAMRDANFGDHATTNYLWVAYSGRCHN